MALDRKWPNDDNGPAQKGSHVWTDTEIELLLGMTLEQKVNKTRKTSDTSCSQCSRREDEDLS